MTVSNTINKIKRRRISELQYLKMATIQDSFKSKELEVSEFEIIKPLKIYKNKTKMLLKYNNKVKY